MVEILGGEMKLADIHIKTDGGPWAEHNMPCAVCGKKHAMLDLETGFFHPCWECRNKYGLTNRRNMTLWNYIQVGTGLAFVSLGILWIIVGITSCTK
jgi:hypothetical protein